MWIEPLALQVGESEADHSKCLRAQLDDVTPRTVYIVDPDHPGADAFAAASTALAAAAMALRRQDGEWQYLEQTCLSHALGMYQVAQTMAERYGESIAEAAKTYPTDSWLTFMFQNAAWLYKATGVGTYKTVSKCAHA